MLIDYLKYQIFPTKSFRKLKESEQDLVDIVNAKIQTVDDSAIKERLKTLLRSTGSIEVNDLGAGSRKEKGNVRKIRKIAKHTSTSSKYGQLYARIIQFYKIRTSIELGTSFGIGTSYLSGASKNVITIEGCPNIAGVAKETFNALKFGNIDLQVGEFSSLLPNLLKEIDHQVLVYIDGNHQLEPTLTYFNFFKDNAAEGSILIFDDIYWSREMKQAWSTIKQHNYFTIDLYRVGIVLLVERAEPENVRIRF